MKLKYYLRGMGIGVLLTAIIMGVALGGNNNTMSDAEIIKRARQLGMVDAGGTLSSYSEAAKGAEENKSDDIASGETLPEEGEKAPEEVNEEQPEAGESVSEVDEEKKESAQIGESSESVETEADITLASTQVDNETSSEPVKEETDNGIKTQQVTKTDSLQSTEAQTEEQNAAPVEQEETKQTSPDTAQTEVQPEQNNSEDTQSGTQAEDQSQEPAPEAQTQQEAPADVNYIVVVIPGGSESDTCARILREAGVITDGVDFNNYLVRSGLDRKIRSGTKQIPKGSGYEQIASIITR